jgi:hypothetical protein
VTIIRPCEHCGTAFKFKYPGKNRFCKRSCYLEWARLAQKKDKPVKERVKAGWTSKEIARLRLLYASMNDDQLVREFFPHPLSSIKQMAAQHKIRKRRCWKEIAESHSPLIRLPKITDETQPQRPWS